MEKLKFAYTIIALILSIAAAAFYRKRRRLQRRVCCYLVSDESKPQYSFKHVLADNSYTLFKHLNQSEDSNSHPYEKEILNLLESSEIEDLRFVNDEVNLELKENYVWVDKEEQLRHLLEVLSKEKVFAVDTEHHSLRSFLGFTALLQISTHAEDYLVDTIALHDVVNILRPVFADPNICKVFHGADNDVTWLQRDFHIYVVNLFDTAKACEVLSKPQKSLAYLLETYCGVATNKVLQRADWRLRPLSEEMIQYARTDAHYLLYIADRMASELKAQNTEPEFPDDKFHFLLEASRLSNRTCLQRYTKEVETSSGKSAASSISSRYLNGQGVSLKPETMELVEWWCMWRDIMARVHDESLRYVLSDQAIIALASKAPMTEAEIYNTISEAGLNSDSLMVDSSLPSPSPVAFSHLENICYLLSENIKNQEDVFGTLIQKHLGPNGSCPLSVYNYALLKNSSLTVTHGFSAKQNGGKNPKRFGRKASRQLFVQKFSCKSPVYHNCRIYASDGRLLCYCDRRKLEWYVRRDLAKVVDEDPPAIVLLFEPKGRPEDEDNDFYIQSKKNMCVGCGERNHYLRYRIIPSCYRVHFPEHLKSHRSHDIVLVCVDCHEIAHSAAEKHKRRIAIEVGIPLFVKKVSDSRQSEVIAGSEENVEEAGVSPLQLRTAAMALLRHGSNMPPERREELTQTVMKFFGGRKISEEDLERALLVGMSPHERRRLEKKKGISLKHSSGSRLPDKANDNDTTSLANGSISFIEAKHIKEDDENYCMEMNTSGGDIHECCDSEFEVKTSSSATISGKENVLDTDEDLESKLLSEDTSNSSDFLPNETGSFAYNKKMSLLGHGPHGKQVVDHLLKEYGEDGIRDFCQRWRQVFVEAIKPRFLPSGWDVMHRGRREFGDYSVFNPLKKATSNGMD